MMVKSDGGDDGGDYYDREGPARVSNTTTSASLRTLLPASLADLRGTAYSPDILSNGTISGGEERDRGGEGDGGDDGGDYSISTSLFAVAARFLGSLTQFVCTYFLFKHRILVPIVCTLVPRFGGT